jgi:hypothetical protein
MRFKRISAGRRPMSKVTKVTNWLSKSLFQPQNLGNPIELQLTEYHEEDGAKGTDRILIGKHANGKLYQFNVFGDNFNLLIDKLGDETDTWIGKKLRIMNVMRGDKEIKQIEVVA